MRNDTHNQLLPWQTVEPDDLGAYPIKPFAVVSPTKKNQHIIHAQLDSKAIKFRRSKKSKSLTQPSQLNGLRMQNHKMYYKSSGAKSIIDEVQNFKVAKNWMDRSNNTCPIKVTQMYSDISDFKKNFKPKNYDKYNHQESIERKIRSDGLQNFTNIQIKSKTAEKDNLKISFSEFLQLRRHKKEKKPEKKQATNQIEIEPAIHVQVGKNINYCNSNFFVRESKNGHVTTKSISNPSLKNKRKNVFSTIKRSIYNNFFEELSMSISKCQDLKSFSLSNCD